MSGFFLIRRERLELSRLKVDGFKVLLEILVTHPELKVVEVPYIFARRISGRSKGNTGEGLRYGRHLVGLAVRTRWRRK